MKVAAASSRTGQALAPLHTGQALAAQHETNANAQDSTHDVHEETRLAPNGQRKDLADAIPEAGPALAGTPAINDGARGRHLRAQPSIDATTLDMLHHKVTNATVTAKQLRGLGGLTTLAEQHFENFEQLIGEGKRTMAPMFTIRVATACTGSSADICSIIAIQRALAATYPGLGFEYVFNCEIKPLKRQWIMALHECMNRPPLDAAPGLAKETTEAFGIGETRTALGHADDAPCCFDDITELWKGSCKCYKHGVSKAKSIARCEVKPFDWLFCSTSCKDFSKLNPQKCKLNVFANASTPGASAQTYAGLLQLLENNRPDLLVFENVIDIAEAKEDVGMSDLEIMKADLSCIGYESIVADCNSSMFGLPQQRRRLYVVALNVRDPRTITFKDRSIEDVFQTFRGFLQVCQRSPACASTFLLPEGHPAIATELSRLTAAKCNTTDGGYNLEKPMQIASKANIPWGTFPPPAWLDKSEWFQQLTRQQKHAICFSIRQHPATHLLRDLRPSFGRTRISAIFDGGRHIANTCVPNQMLMAFPINHPPVADDGQAQQSSLGAVDATQQTQETFLGDANQTEETSLGVAAQLVTPRFVLGREHFALQGFPINIIPYITAPECVLKETMFTDLAGNMVSTPVFLAMVASTMAAVSWRPSVDISIGPVDGAPMADAHNKADEGLLHGGLDPAVANNTRTERRGGLLFRTYAKVIKTHK